MQGLRGLSRYAFITNVLEANVESAAAALFVSMKKYDTIALTVEVHKSACTGREGVTVKSAEVHKSASMGKGGSNWEELWRFTNLRAWPITLGM